MTRWNDGRRAHGLVLAGALWLTGCGGIVTYEDDPLVVPPPAEGCGGESGCPGGYRCELGECVVSVECPQPIAPQLLHTVSAADSFDFWTTATVQGRDLIQLTAQRQYPPQKATELETFLDPLSGETTTWAHTPGSGFFFACADGLCGYEYGTDGSETIDLGLELHDGAWSTTRRYPLPNGHRIFGDDRYYGPGTLLIESNQQHLVSKWTPATGSVEPVVSVDGYTVWSPVATSEGWQLLGRQLNGEAQVASWSVTSLGSGAWEPLFDVQGPWFYGPTLLRSGQQWFAIHDPNDPVTGARRYHVYRVGVGEQVETGSSTDPALFDLSYYPGDPDRSQLGDDHVGRVVSCTKGTCRLVSIDLDTVTVTEQASVTIAASSLVPVSTRWLDCGAVDVLIGSYVDDPATPGQAHPGALWYARLVP